jgi:hypothetical protein
LLNRPLALRWQLLRGDPSRVTIETDTKTGAAKIRVRWHPPMTGETGILSHRVDIGVFAANGVSVSAPSFVTFYMLPNEFRTFDEKGRVSEIYYETANPHLGLPAQPSDFRWLDVMRTVAMKGDGLRSELIEKAFSRTERVEIEKTLLDLLPKMARLEELQKNQDKDPARKTEADKLRATLDADIAAAIQREFPGEKKATMREVMARGFSSIAATPALYTVFQKEIDAMAKSSPKPSADADLRASVKRLIDLGIMIQEANGLVSTVRSVEALREGEREQLRGLNLTVMSQCIYPQALLRSPAPAFSDKRLTASKPWRDVYRYDDAGALMGWIRYHEGRTTIFSADGARLPEGFGKKQAAQNVTYADDGKGGLTFK